MSVLFRHTEPKRTELAEQLRAGERDLYEIADLRDLLVKPTHGRVRVRTHATFNGMAGNLHRRAHVFVSLATGHGKKDT